MRIIKKGKIPRIEYKMTCKNCGCVALYDKSDIQEDRESRYLVCPTCGCFVTVGWGKDLQFESKETK